MHVKIQFHYIFSLLVFFFLGCNSSDEGASVDAPNTDISCSTSKCSVSGVRDVVINLTLSGCSPDQIGFENIATGSGEVLCNGSSCTGTVREWSPATFASRTYYVCGWIDADPGIKSANDAFSESQIYISGSPLSISNWSVTYSFSTKHSKNK